MMLTARKLAWSVSALVINLRMTRDLTKYDSIDWQDDDPSKNLSVKEMDKILEEKDQNNSNNDETDSGQDNSSNENGNNGDSSGGE